MVSICSACVGWGTERLLVLGSGDCADQSFNNKIKAFQLEMTAISPASLIPLDAALGDRIAQLKPEPSAIAAQVAKAKSLLYRGETERGHAAVNQLLPVLAKGAPFDGLWQHVALVHIVRAQLFKNEERTTEAVASFRQVLRLDPNAKVDPDFYPPSTIKLFMGVAKELMREKRFSLRIESPQKGARVFLDGREIGATPLHVKLVAGSYRLVVQHGQDVSLIHDLEIGGHNKVSVDPAFEAAISKARPVCVSQYSDEALLSLGRQLSAAQAIVVRSTQNELIAELYDVVQSRKVRAAMAPHRSLAKLAASISSNQQHACVQPYLNSPAAKWPVGCADEPSHLNGKDDVSIELAPFPTTSGPLVQVNEVTTVSAARVVSISLLGAGAVAVGAGVVTWIGIENDRRSLASLQTTQAIFDTSSHSEATLLMRRMDATTTSSLVFVGAGVGSALAGTLGLVLFPGHQTSVSVIPISGGAASTIAGQF